ncbi:MAG: copper resistance CopC family protein [Chloroflexota bacterium]
MSIAKPLRAVGAAGILFAATASLAAAHVEIESSSPEAGENLQTAPTEVTITFNEELDPDASSFSVTDADEVEVGTGEVDLAIADRNMMRGAVTITDPGVYTVSYAVTGDDGHLVEGTFSFGFQATGEVPEPTGGEPDTAMAPSGPPALELVLLGALFLLLSGVTAARHFTLR